VLQRGINQPRRSEASSISRAVTSTRASCVRCTSGSPIISSIKAPFATHSATSARGQSNSAGFVNDST
jgi:hypothetical protein